MRMARFLYILEDLLFHFGSLYVIFSLLCLNIHMAHRFYEILSFLIVSLHIYKDEKARAESSFL